MRRLLWAVLLCLSIDHAAYAQPLDALREDIAKLRSAIDESARKRLVCQSGEACPDLQLDASMAPVERLFTELASLPQNDRSFRARIARQSGPLYERFRRCATGGQFLIHGALVAQDFKADAWLTRTSARWLGTEGLQISLSVESEIILPEVQMRVDPACPGEGKSYTVDRVGCNTIGNVEATAPIRLESGVELQVELPTFGDQVKCETDIGKYAPPLRFAFPFASGPPWRMTIGPLFRVNGIAQSTSEATLLRRAEYRLDIHGLDLVAGEKGVRVAGPVVVNWVKR
jgi:hypothetical protein